MFFIASKLVESVLVPSNAIGIAAALGLVLLLLRWRKTGSTLLAMVAVLLLVLGWLPLGSGALLALENRFPEPDLPGKIAGIVVLGGEINTHISYDRGVVAINDAGERLTKTADLARRFPDARIIHSGGIAHLSIGHGETESVYARKALVGMGVPADRIELEERSRNTCENALRSKEMARPASSDNWLLVTSAYHMPRAVACFRAAGFPATPYPVDFRMQSSGLWHLSKSIAEGLGKTDLAIHEWIGLAAYHMFKETELFPAPRGDD